MRMQKSEHKFLRAWPRTKAEELSAKKRFYDDLPGILFIGVRCARCG